MTHLYQLWAFLKRDYLLASASRLALAWQLTGIIFAVPVLYYLGRLISPATSPHLAAFGGDYFGFVVLGVAVLGLLSVTMRAPATAVRLEQLTGTLESVLAAPTPLPALAMGVSLWSVLLAALQAALYVLVAVRVFGLDFSHANLISVLTILILALISYFALGVIAAAFVLVTRQGDPLTGLIAAASTLLAGVFYPTSVLPAPLERLARLIPLTPALHALRLAVLRGQSLGALWHDVSALLLFAAVLVPLALAVSGWMLRQAKISGTLSAY
jgi:ABC-2 type transport system permease protein